MKVIARFTLYTLLAGLAAGLAAYAYLRQSLPKTTGEIVVAGLAQPVEVLRDAYGIPHIYAASLEDAHFALGYVHAQDRLWQMEMNRRIAAGRLAEILGPRALESDRFLRTLGVRRAAEANLAGYDAETRRLLDAYAAGVNAFLARGPVLPPEFWLTRASPEPWSGADSVGWMKMMAWDLATNWRNELLRMRLARTLPTARIQEFLPPYPGDPVPEIADLRALYGGLEKQPIRLGGLNLDADALGGSNGWAVSGARSASGKPLLANDPHLGLSAPPIWYLAHLHAPGLNAIGATLPGVPAILVGRNDRVAWGLTNTVSDVQDLYLEKLDGSFAQRDEVIKVRGAADEKLEVRVSRHGPVISDVLGTVLDAAPRGYAIALAWTALAENDPSMQAALRLSRARDWREFNAALRDLHAPQQNVLYADIDGNIGFVAAGRVPVRKAANDLKGLAPAPGWDARYDWAGFVPFEELPRAFNPASGAIVNANHKIVPPGYPYHISYEWQPPYRARRIEELLAAGPQTLDSFSRIQLDVVSLAAKELLPKLLATEPQDEDSRNALAALAAWDGSMSAERAEPLIFVAWWRELARAIYADELGDAFASAWGPRIVFTANALGANSRWCDDVRTTAVESCAALQAQSLRKALAELRRRYGDPAGWKWGKAHPAHHRHAPLTRQPLLARLFDFSVPSPGGTYTVNVGRYDFNDDDEPFASHHGPSLRMLCDLGDPESSLFIQSGGQSGNPLSSHYHDFTAPWARGEYIPMVTNRSRLEAAGAERLVLRPAAAR
jgi:penicillin amidase